MVKTKLDKVGELDVYGRIRAALWWCALEDTVRILFAWHGVPDS